MKVSHLFILGGLLLATAGGPALSAESKNPDHAEALKAHKAGEMDRAEGLYLEAIEKDPKNAVVRMDYADLLMLKGEFQSAKTHYEAAIATSPGNATAHTNLGLVYEALGDIDKAEAEHKQALKIDPNHPQAHLNLGHVFEVKKMFEEAKAEYKKAILINMNYLLAYESLGQVMSRTGDYSGSADTYKKALTIDPQSAAIHNNLAHAYYKMGDDEKAVQMLEKTLALDPENEVIKKNLAYLLEQVKSKGNEVAVSPEAKKVVEETLAAEEVSDDALQKASGVSLAVAPVRESVVPGGNVVSNPTQPPVEEETLGVYEPTGYKPKKEINDLSAPDAYQARRMDSNARSVDRDAPEEGTAVALAPRVDAPGPREVRTYRGPKPSGAHGFSSQQLPSMSYTLRLYPVDGSQPNQSARGLRERLTERLYSSLAGLGVFKVVMASPEDDPILDKQADFVVRPSLSRAATFSGKGGFAGFRGSENTKAEVIIDLSVVDRLNGELHTRSGISGGASQRGMVMFQDEMAMLNTAMEGAASKAVTSIRSLLLSVVDG